MKTQGIRLFILLLVALFARTAIGQVNVTVRVLPPYQSRITEYASRPDLMLLTITNTTTRQQRVQLTASISGDNGIGAWVNPGYRSPQPIELAPGQALALNGSDIAMLFDHNQIQYTGISQADFQRGVGLLEGTYQLCIRALDYDTHEPISPEEPMGCTQIVISSVEPPTIIQPFNEQELRADGPQAFPITWSTPPGSSPLTQYKVKMVEMIAPRNPNDAMQSATTPPFFEETVNTNMLLYGPQYPQLTPGRQYALMVQAVDPYGTLSFRNQGMSEVIMFTYGQPSGTERAHAASDIELYFPYRGLDTLHVSRDSTFYARWGFADTAANRGVEFVMTIKEKNSRNTVFEIRDVERLYYQSRADSLDFLESGHEYRLRVSGVDPRTGAVVGQSRIHDFVYRRVADGVESEVDSVTLVATVNYQYDGYADRYPYQGKVYLYEAQPTYRQVSADSVLLTGYVPMGNAVAEGETDTEGNVRVPVSQPTPDAHYLMAFHNPYFDDPKETFKLNASAALEDQSTASQQQNRRVEQRVGDITTTVKSYSLKFALTKGYGYIRDILRQSQGVYTNEVQAAASDQNKELSGYVRTDTLAMINESLAGLMVRVYRKGKSVQVPFYEGGRAVAPNNDPGQLVLVAEDTTRLVTDEQGIARAVADIDRLVWSQSASDLYHIQVYDPATDSVVIEQAVRFHPSEQQRAQQVEQVSPTHYLVSQGLSWVVEAPPLATVKGRLLYRWFDGEGGTHPLANKKLRLEPYYVFEDPQTGKMTAVNGNADHQIVRVNANNQEARVAEDEKFGDRPPVISASAVTVTTADGSFAFEDFALYDSIFTYEGYYNLLPIRFEAPELPPALEDPGQLGQQHPGNIWDEDGGNGGSGIWTPGGGFTLPGGGPVLPDYLSDLLGGGGSGPGGQLPGGPLPGGGLPGVGPGSLRTLDMLGQAGALSQVGLGVSLKNTSPKVNGVVNSPKVVTRGGASALKMEQFHNGASHMGGAPVQIQQPQLNQRGGPSWEDSYEAMATPVQQDMVYNNPMKLRRTYRVVIEDERFLSPDDNVEVNPLEIVDLGTLYSLVNSYKARVKVVERNPDWDDYMVQQNDLPAPNDYRSRYHPEAAIDKNNSPALTNIKVQLKKGDLTQTAAGATGDIAGEDVETLFFSQADANRNVFAHLVNHTRYSFTSETNDTIQANNSYIGSTTDGAGSEALHGSQILHYFNAGQGYIRFNNEYREQTKDIFLVLEPKAPVVAGRVLNDKGVVPIAGAVVELRVGNSRLVQRTDTDGYFVFTNVAEGNPLTLSCDVPGYKPKGGGQRFTEVRNTISKGEKWFKEIYFTPSATVRGYVVNDAGEQVPALVKVEGTGQLVETECGPDGTDKARARALYERGLLSAAQWSQYACNEAGGYFQVGVQAGVRARVIITPLDLQYFPDTVVLENPVDGLNDLQARRVSRRLHRMQFAVRAPGPDGQALALEGTTIELLDTVLTATRSDANGMTGGAPRAYYEFANISQHNFWVKVIPPEGSGFVPREITLTNRETKEPVLHLIDMEEGDAVWGTVTAAGNPLADAEVSVYQGDGAATVRVLTDASGQYRINGLRPGEGELQVQVSSPESSATIAGKTQQATPNTEVNFELATYDKLDVSTLLGYQVRITEVTDEGSEAVVSGELILPDDSEFAAFDEDRRLTFSGVRVRANTAGVTNDAGTPLAEPVEDIALDNVNFRTRFGAYNVLLQGQAGSQSPQPLRVHKESATSGELDAYARIVDNSFDFPSSYLEFGDSEFYFAVAGAGSAYTNKLALAPSMPETSTPTRYHFSNATGGALSFRYLNFDATSAVVDNYFADGHIHIKPVIHARVNTLGDDPLTIAMPSLHFNTVTIAEAQGSEAIEFKLEEWTVHIPNWKAATDEGSIVATSGQNYVRTGAGLDLYFDSFRLVQLGTSDELIIDGVRANNIKLGGFHPIQVYGGTNTLFGLDMKTGNDLRPHYILRMLGKGNNMAGKIDNLPGFAGGLEIQAVTLVSNGQQYVSFAPNSREVNVHGVVGFKPSMLTDSDGGFVVEGNLDMGIPHMPGLSGGFEFKPGTGNRPEMTLRLRELEFELKGNVRFRSEAVAFNENGRKFIRANELEIWGTASEPGKLDEIPVRLLKKVGGGRTDIDIQLRGTSYVMKMDGDKISMDVSKAWTTVVGDTWDYFQFTGKMSDGFASGGFGREMMTFKVHGDIKLEEGQVKLTEIPTPFGEVELVFDWQRKEIRGSIAIQNANGGKIGFPGGVSAKGMAEILLGPQGFYFMAAVEAEIDPLPLISLFSAGFVIGYHDAIPQEVFEKATQHMYYKSYPCDENGVAFKGFMFAGRKDIIKPVEFSIAIPPVLTADISLEVGADVTFYTNFANGVEIALVVGVFGKVELVAKTLASCTSLEGKIALELMGRLAYANSTFVGEICASLAIATKVEQSTPPLCVPKIFDFDEDITIGAKIGLEATGSGVKPYFQLIRESCSSGTACRVVATN